MATGKQIEREAERVLSEAQDKIEELGRAARALPTLLDAHEVAEQTGIPRATLYALAREKQIPHVRVGRAVRFSAPAVRHWIESGGTNGSIP